MTCMQQKAMAPIAEDGFLSTFCDPLPSPPKQHSTCEAAPLTLRTAEGRGGPILLSESLPGLGLLVIGSGGELVGACNQRKDHRCNGDGIPAKKIQNVLTMG